MRSSAYNDLITHTFRELRAVLDGCLGTRREKDLGLHHPKVAESLSHVGQLLQRLGRCVEAEPFLVRAVKIEKDEFGETHLKAKFQTLILLSFYVCSK